MTLDASPPSLLSRGRAVLEIAVRFGLPVVWLVWAVLSWWVTPREVDTADLERDLAADRVVTWQRAEGWSDDEFLWARRQPEPRPYPRGDVIAWTASNGQTRWTTIDPVVGPLPDADPYSARLADADPWSTRQGLTHRLTAVVGGLGSVLAVVWLALLVGGPKPAAGTRWFWWWLGLLPYGLGMLAWVDREWWRRRQKPAHDRYTGWFGLGCLVGVSIVVSLLLLALRAVLGGWVVPV
ncbi:hypothetical protein [Micromonospora endolithica]|uniref:Uncharacterized protein n=1 Tax=Micromonospora endolithica TaxID=230091 RepID=A0A3A9Z042_9ACTN|nr:hypothetical protein [Micromonospora endolithica]RKN41379.1 hypothetical protein D7223_23815 [Micromonospora endolithica]TWJ21794.1 hypothetical protein JD76_01906 [Micromonospora endolithica]